jgi:hypothetical protein
MEFVIFLLNSATSHLPKLTNCITSLPHKSDDLISLACAAVVRGVNESSGRSL